MERHDLLRCAQAPSLLRSSVMRGVLQPCSGVESGSTSLPGVMPAGTAHSLHQSHLVRCAAP